MNQNAEAKEKNCENCAWRKRAEARPKSLLALLWRWHTKWCPGWKAYQQSLREEGKQ